MPLFTRVSLVVVLAIIFFANHLLSRSEAQRKTAGLSTSAICGVIRTLAAMISG